MLPILMKSSPDENRGTVLIYADSPMTRQNTGEINFQTTFFLFLKTLVFPVEIC